MHPARCVSTHRFHADKTQNIDLERADGRTKDHAAFPPGNAASSVTIANLRPALWSLMRSSCRQAQRVFGGRRKSHIQGTCRAFAGKCCIILVKANPRPDLRNTVPVATKAVRSFAGRSSCVYGLLTAKPGSLFSLEDCSPAQR